MGLISANLYELESDLSYLLSTITSTDLRSIGGECGKENLSKYLVGWPKVWVTTKTFFWYCYFNICINSNQQKIHCYLWEGYYFKEFYENQRDDKRAWKAYLAWGQSQFIPCHHVIFWAVLVVALEILKLF